MGDTVFINQPFNQQGTQVSIPSNGEIYRTEGGQVFKRVGGQVVQIEETQIAQTTLRGPDGTVIQAGQPVDTSNGKSAGASGYWKPVDSNFRGATVKTIPADELFKAQYGADAYNALPVYNSADIGAASKEGVLQTAPGTNSVNVSGGNVSDFNPANAQVSPAGSTIQANQAALQQTQLPAGVASVNAPQTPSGNLASVSPDNATPVTLGNGQTVYVTPEGAFFDEQGRQLSNAQVSSVQTGAGNISGGVDLTGLPPEFQSLYNELDNYLTDLERRGQQVNPNVTIDESKLQEFAAQAAKEIDPYYANLFKTSVDDFLYGLGYSKSELLQNERKLEQQYGKDVRTLGENAAEQGFAQSGIRQERERELAQETQDKINTGRRALQFTAESGARQLAGEFGAANIPAVSIGNAPTVGAGESSFGRNLNESPLYNLSDTVYAGLKGTRQFEQEAAKRTRASELESAYREKQGLAQERSLTL